MKRVISIALQGGFGFIIITLALLLVNGPDLCPWRSTEPAHKFPKESHFTSYGKAYAIPVFARKYGTSCQTCHSAFPNLTPFGKAFKNNGLRWPGEDRDPNYTKKDEPVSLGAKVYEDMWPNAVWPGEIPGFPPISLAILSQYISQPRNSESNNKNQFQGFGSQISLLSSGTLGRAFSLWGGVGFNVQVNQNTGATETDVSVERLYSVITPFERPVFTIRLGNIEPRLAAISVHRSLLGGYFLTTDQRVGNNGFTLEGAQQGIEFAGFPGGRFGYYVGVVEGTGNALNIEKDVYGRLEYKFGGLRSDGIVDESYTSSDPWRDDSITLGTFGYLGFATVTNATSTTPATQRQKDRFEIFGADLDINYADLLVNLGYARQENNRPLLATPTMSVSTNQYFGELNWVAYPWLIPGVKFELFDSGPTMIQRITLGSTFLVRANIKAFLRGTLLKPDGGDFFDEPEIRAGLFMAL